jgi:DNA-binding MarR family transcriptional regulator
MEQTTLEGLLNEVRLLYQSMVKFGNHIHEDSQISMGMRAVLEYLAREGDATVPQMARDRRVTRQRIQSLVDSLLTMELVDRRENARNRRSPLIELTAKGRRTIQSMRKREGQFINTSVSEKRLSTAASVLKEVRSSLEEGPAVDQKAVAK